MKNIALLMFFLFPSFALGSVSGNAGCILRSGDQLVFVKDIWSKRYGLPGGTTDGKETPEQTAERETLEETGIPVTAKSLLVTTPNSFRIYDCQPKENKIETLERGRISVPKEAFNEIGEIVLIDPHKLQPQEWRFPQQRELILSLVSKATDYPHVSKEMLESPSLIAAELQWMQAFHSYQNRILDALFQLFSFFGGEGFALFLIPLICFGVNQRKGIELTFLFLVGILLSGIFKQVFGIPRPFFYLPSLQRADAEGFGFPSGHTLSVTLVWSWIAYYFQFRWKWTIAFLIALLGGLARVYWGVHFFHDVLGGWALGLAVVMGYTVYLKANNIHQIELKTWYVVALCTAVLALIVRPHPETVIVSSLLVGLFLVFSLSHSAEDFSVGKNLKAKMVELSVVLLGIFVIFAAFNVVFSSGAFLPCLFSRILKYSLLGIWIGWTTVLFRKKRRLQL